MKKSLSSVICLTVISLVVTALLAVTNSFTAPVIVKAEKEAAFQALSKVLPGGSFSGDVEITDISEEVKKIGVTAAYKEDNGGFVVTIETAGYSTGLKIMFGVDAKGNITGSEVLASSETLGYEKTYGDVVLGKDLTSVDSVSTVAGATKTTTAYKNAAKAAIQAAMLLSGVEVDTRSEEEILNDNLNNALGTNGVVFTQWFKTEDIAADVYTSEAGYVFVTDNKFAGVKADGSIVNNDTELSTEDIKAAVAAIKGPSASVIDFSGLEISDRVTEVRKTSSGNYVFTVNASGFGKRGDPEYGISGKFFVVQIAVTANGKVLDCEVLEQYETDGIGSVCAERSFGSRYVGSTADTISSVDAQAGATFTSDGYKGAVKNAIEAALKLKEAGR